MLAIRQDGGDIYDATKRRRWPGLAAVVISVVHVAKRAPQRSIVLNGHSVPKITAFLFARGNDADPARLAVNAGRAFIGCFVRGMGFTFDDASDRGSSLRDMERLVAADPTVREVVKPYIGGEEVLNSPEHRNDRYVIHFGDRSLVHLGERWPDLLDIVTVKVKPTRDALGNSAVDRAHKAAWWRFANDRPELYAAIGGRTRVAVIPRVSQHLCVAWLPSNWVYSDQLVVMPGVDSADVASLQSRVHEVWARFFASTLGDGLRYNPSDCFETYPFPMKHDGDDRGTPLDAAGQTYYDFRAALMVRNDEGLTKTYNRFHDPNERSPDIRRLRELHAAMDRAVLDAYGWTDVATDCDFFLDYEIDEETWGDKKKPYRYRWPDAVRDEVLARLLDLNQKRHQEELAAGLLAKGDAARPAAIAPAAKGKAARKPAKGKAKAGAGEGAGTESLTLFRGAAGDDDEG